MFFSFNILMKIVFIFFLTLFVFLIFINFNYNNKVHRETFISKLKLDKKLVIVVMDGLIENEYTNTIKSLCESYIDNFTYNFDEDKVSNLKKVNITYDKSFDTSSKIKNVNYLVLYQNNSNNSNNNYNKKFIKKWCSKSKKEKENFIVIDYDKINIDKAKILNDIEKKFKIDIPMKGLLNLGSFNNININDITNLSSNISMDELTKQFMNKI